VPNTRYIFITGGVASSLGKGVTIASIGALLEARGFKVTIQKMDPYINVDPGTMSPFQHGEVYVTSDGAETDLDLGYYERFTDAKLTILNSITTGRIYRTVIERERNGEYHGKTVQVVPHITSEIQSRILRLSDADPNLDFVLVEIGGTVGDIESVPFLEAIRQFRFNHGRDKTLYIHLTLVPTVSVAGEIKTKPTQHSVKELLKQGIQPDILVSRATQPLSPEIKEKISQFTNVPQNRVFSAADIDYTIYEVPLNLHREGIDDVIIQYFGMENVSPLFQGEMNPMLQKWEKILDYFKNPSTTVKIAIVGKYVEVSDAYRSLYEALWHGGFPHKCKVESIKVDSEKITPENYKEYLSGIQGILVPGGFGNRGVEGKLIAIQYARESKIPFFGICLGMQCAVIEYGRNVLGLEGANSTEFNPDTPHPVIHIMDEQIGVNILGDTARKGSFPCEIRENTRMEEAYGQKIIQERHRHRYEFNNRYLDQFVRKGLVISGVSPGKTLVEAVELSRNDHPWFVGTQFHPEFQSKPHKPHPLFVKFIEAAIQYQKENP